MNPSSRAKLATGCRKLGKVVEFHYEKGISRYDRKLDGKYPIYGANGELGRTDKFLVDGEADYYRRRFK